MTLREASDAMAEELARLQELSACQEDVDSIDAVIAAYRAVCEEADKAQTWHGYAVATKDFVPCVIEDTPELCKGTYADEFDSTDEEIERSWMQAAKEYDLSIIRVTVTEDIT